MKTRIQQCITFVISFLLLPALIEAQTHKRRVRSDKRLSSHPQPVQLSPQELFKRASRSIFVVEALDQHGSVISFGSAVALETIVLVKTVSVNVLITNHHVIKDAASLRVKQGALSWEALIYEVDANNDLCLLVVVNLPAITTSFRQSSTLAIGERVYAIGTPEGLELTLSEGLISGLRKINDGGLLIQTTAPISHGSSGGGLFDANGKLVGITAFKLEAGQQLNFALPSDLLLTPKEKFRYFIQNKIWKMAVFRTIDGDEAKREGNENKAASIYRKAVELFNEALRLDRNDYYTWESLGETYEKLGHLDQALAAYRKAAQLRPDNSDAHISIGTLLFKRGNFNEALSEYRQALRGKIERSYQYESIGYALADLGALDEAILAYREGIRLGIKEKDLLLCSGSRAALGHLLLKKGAKYQALSEFNLALKCYDCIADASCMASVQGAIEFANGEFAKAVEKFRKAQSLDQLCCVPYIMLAEALEAKGDLNAALTEYKKVVTLFPESLQAKKQYQRLLAKISGSR